MRGLRLNLFIVLALFLTTQFTVAAPWREQLYQKQSSGRQVIYEQGSIYIYRVGERVSKYKVDEILARSKGRDGYAIYKTKDEIGRTISSIFASAPNVRSEHRIVNSYLVGYAPFKAENIWVPLMTLAKKKQYQYDHLQYPGHEEVWQTSKESFNSPRGDCEDHAIALADWLIEMGEDARVVLGMHRNEGHAWVVLFKQGKQFLLEATSKFNARVLKRYPLTSMYLDYHPYFMFNRDDFWFNSGSTNTTDYASKQWEKKSRYIRVSGWKSRE